VGAKAGEARNERRMNAGGSLSTGFACPCSVASMHPIERLRYVARSSGADERLLVHETAAALHGLRMEPADLVIACRRIVERHPSSGPLWWLCSQVLTAPDPFAALRRLADEVDEDTTPSMLVHALPDDATVCVVGWPDLAGDALFRRGDVRVLAVDTDGHAGGLVRRLERVDVEAEEVPAGAIAAAVSSADIVLIEPTAVCAETRDGGGEALATMGSRALASSAYCAGVPVWMVAGVGRRLPVPTWTTLVERVGRASVASGPWWARHESVPVALATHVVDMTGVHELTEGSAPTLLAAECPVAHELLRSSPI
jgi:hypothetical protein